MSPSTPISAGASSVAAIVGAAPSPTRSAGDGSPAPESFAQALSQASGPPPPEPARPAAAPRSEPQAEQARPEPSTGEPRSAATPDGAAAARHALQRKVAGPESANRATVASGMSPSGSAPQPGTEQPLDSPAKDHTADHSDALPDAGGMAAVWLSGIPAANQRASGKATAPGAGATGIAATAVLPARGAAAAAADSANAPPSAATPRRGEASTVAVQAAVEREAAADSANAPPSAATPRRGEASTGAVQAAIEREAAANGASPAPAAPPGPLPAAPMAAALPLPATLVAGAFSNHAAASAPTEGRLQASPGSLEFAPALGAQLNLFLRDGVQHARLQLHPAEMGPLTVQIQLDGAAAQVRLAAEHPLTRQALEQAMPTLASALRESGLTLTGGGVFEQPADPQQQEGRAPAASRTPGTPDTTNDPVAATPRAPLARRGVVDLVA